MWVISHVLVIQILCKTLPIKEGDHLRISWPITPSFQFYKEGPCHYLSHLIEHEGEGSIFRIIKELGKFTSTVGCCTYTFADLIYWDIVHVILYLSTCNISNLATLGWAMYLEAGETTDSDSNEYSFFSVGISLTDAGHGQFSFIFAYLDLD